MTRPVPTRPTRRAGRTAATVLIATGLLVFGIGGSAQAATYDSDSNGDTFVMITSGPTQTVSSDGEVTITFDYDLRPDTEREGISVLLDVHVEDAAGEGTWVGEQLMGVDGPGTFDHSVTLKPGTYTRRIMSTYVQYCDCLPIKDIIEPYTFTVPEKVDPTPTPTPTPTVTPSPEPTPTATATPAPTPEPTSTPSPEPTATPTPQPTETASPSPTASASPVAVSLSSTTVARGNQVTVSASGLAAGESVGIWLHSTPIKLLSATASADGTISKTVTIPADAAIGSHRIEVRGATSGSAYASLTVANGLAVTGFDRTSTTAAGIGASVLVLGGIAFVLVARRRAGAHS